MKSGTKTMFFLPYAAIPKHKKPTYPRVVAAFRPNKETLVASASPLVAIELNMQAMSAPKPPTSPLSNFSSTASSALPMPDS
jgi:hypothetical protein